MSGVVDFDQAVADEAAGVGERRGEENGAGGKRSMRREDLIGESTVGGRIDSFEEE